VTTNDLVLVKQLLMQRKSAVAAELPDNDYFQVFATEHALKDRDLSYDEIQDDIVDGGGDGGIDAVFLFINNNLCREPIKPEEYKRNVPIELAFIQCKYSSGFSESSVQKIAASARDLLNLEVDKAWSRKYNPCLLEKVAIFRTCYLSLASKFPKLSIHHYYASLATAVHPNVEGQVAHLKYTVESAFSPVDFSFTFLTATKLLTLARQAPTAVYQLRLAESPI
jgi:hypothetical protein